MVCQKDSRRWNSVWCASFRLVHLRLQEVKQCVPTRHRKTVNRIVGDCLCSCRCWVSLSALFRGDRRRWKARSIYQSAPAYITECDQSINKLRNALQNAINLSERRPWRNRVLQISIEMAAAFSIEKYPNAAISTEFAVAVGNARVIGSDDRWFYRKVMIFVLKSSSVCVFRLTLCELCSE